MPFVRPDEIQNKVPSAAVALTKRLPPMQRLTTSVPNRPLQRRITMPHTLPKGLRHKVATADKRQ